MKFSLRWVLSLLLMSSFSWNLLAQEQRFPNLMAKLWVERAVHVAEQAQMPQDWELAQEALDIAEEYALPGPDVHYLRAHMGIYGSPSVSLGIREAYELAQSSLKGAARYISFADRAALFATLALQLKEYKSLFDAFEAWPLGERQQPSLLYAAARASLYLGDLEKAGEWAMLGESLEDGQSDLSPFGAVSAPLPAFRALAIASQYAGAMDTLADAHRRWGQSLSQAIEPWILAGYILPKPGDDVAQIVGSGLTQLSAYLEYARQGGELENLDLSHLPTRLASDGAILSLLNQDSLMEGQSGVVGTDANYDGHYEQWLRLVNGRPDYRHIDEDQDGHSEWEIRYFEGSIVQIRRNDGQLSVNYEPQAYPQVLSVTGRYEGGTARFSFHPGALSWAPFSETHLLAQVHPLSESWNTNAFDAAVRTSELTLPLEDGARRVETVFFQGKRLESRESRFASGEDSQPLWVRERLYSQGELIAGRLAYGLVGEENGARVWPVYERYEKGRRVGLVWAPEMEGPPLYIEDKGLGAILQIQAWDAQGDGWIDYHRYLPPPEGEAGQLLIGEAQAQDLIPWTASYRDPWE